MSVSAKKNQGTVLQVDEVDPMEADDCYDAALSSGFQKAGRVTARPLWQGRRRADHYRPGAHGETFSCEKAFDSVVEHEGCCQEADASSERTDCSHN